MKRFVIVYLTTAIVLLPLDFLFLGTIGKKLFDTHVRDMVLHSPRMAPAVLFYILYFAGIVIFVNGAAPSAWRENVLYGALFGVFCYATFELTSMAMLKHWEWAIVVPDIVWGGVVTGTAAALGGLLANWLIGMPDNVAAWVGAGAALLSSLSYLPQVKKAWPRGSTHDLSLGMLLVLTAGLSLWIVYGMIRGDWVIAIANGAAATLTGTVLAFKVRDVIAGRAHGKRPLV